MLRCVNSVRITTYRKIKPKLFGREQRQPPEKPLIRSKGQGTACRGMCSEETCPPPILFVRSKKKSFVTIMVGNREDTALAERCNDCCDFYGRGALYRPDYSFHKEAIFCTCKPAEIS